MNRLFRYIAAIKGSKRQKEIAVKRNAFYQKCMGCEYSVVIKPDAVKCICGNRNPIRTRSYGGIIGEILKPCNYKPSRWRQHA
jgi:hypothetical protein